MDNENYKIKSNIIFNKNDKINDRKYKLILKIFLTKI